MIDFICLNNDAHSDACANKNNKRFLIASLAWCYKNREYLQKHTLLNCAPDRDQPSRITTRKSKKSLKYHNFKMAANVTFDYSGKVVLVTG